MGQNFESVWLSFGGSREVKVLAMYAPEDFYYWLSELVQMKSVKWGYAWNQLFGQRLVKARVPICRLAGYDSKHESNKSMQII